MARIELAPEVNDDFARIIEHLQIYDVTNAKARIQEIIQAISVLEHKILVSAAPHNNKNANW